MQLLINAGCSRSLFCPAGCYIYEVREAYANKEAV